MTTATAAKRRVLVVDDEENVTHLVSSALRFDGFETVTADNGQSALAAVAEADPDLVVLDVMMPGDDGFTLCRKLRAANTVPLILLTARNSETDRIVGLELGADDYVTKPFSPAELVARVKAVLRRTDQVGGAEVIAAGDVAVDLGRREVRVRGEAVAFTTKEFELLQFLAEHPGLALSRQQILDGVWGYDWFGDSRTVDVHVAQLRKKLDGAVQIDTVRGVGYRLEAT